MAALTKNIEIITKDGEVVAHKMAAATHVYNGSLVKIGAAGYAAPCATESGAVFAGLAIEEMNNTGAAGDKVVRVYRRKVALLTGAGFTIADVGSVVYALDDATVQLSAGTDLQAAGTIVGFESATQVWVALNGI